MNKEIEYLTKKINDVKYNDERFKVMIGNEKFIFGSISGAGQQNTVISKIMEYKTLYDTLKDLDIKIKFSFQEAIKYSYSDIVQNGFSIFQKGSVEEFTSYYYIENALFRTSTLWDILAQLYRLYYQIEIEQSGVYYKKIFNPNSSNSIKFKDKANEIYKYINQEDNTDINDEWQGNHTYVNECRNKMIHRNSPNIAVMSDYDINFKKHPSFMLKRIIEDYHIVSKYINEILNKIESQCIEIIES